MRTWKIIAPVTLAVLAAGCGETTTQKATTGAAGGAVAGGIVGGPVGALVGAGIGGAGGAYQDELEPRADRAVDQAFNRAEQEIQGESGGATGAAIGPAETGQAGTAPRQHADLTNQEVREAQTALKDMGLYDGEIDGLYGPRTISAVKEFQTQQDLRLTGALSQQTQQEIQTAARNGGAAREGQAAQTGAEQSPDLQEPAQAQSEQAQSEQAQSEQAQSEQATESEQRGATGAAIEPPERAASGLNSQEVREAQTALKDIGLYEGEIDGIYGPRTINAVREFQGQHDLERTGALDEETRQRLRTAASQRGAAREGQPMGGDRSPASEPSAAQPQDRPDAESPTGQSEPATR